MIRENYTADQFFKDISILCCEADKCINCSLGCCPCPFTNIDCWGSDWTETIDVVYKWVQGHPESEGQE